MRHPIILSVQHRSTKIKFNQTMLFYLQSGSYNEMDSYIEESGDDDKIKNDELMEATSKGVITGSVFLRYFRTGSGLFWPFFVLILYVLTQFAASLNDMFVPYL